MAGLDVLSNLLDELPLGVVVLDREGTVVHYNRYEEILAGRRRERVVGRDFFREIAPCMNVKDLGQRFHAAIGREPLHVELEFAFPLPFLEHPRDVVVRMVSFEVGGAPFGALLIEDVSARRSVERMKETLSSLLVHDLKNPLAVVMSNLKLLRDTETIQTDPDAFESTEGAMRSAERLQHMVLNLLDITRLETNAMPLDRREADLGRLLAAAVEESRPLARIRGAEIILDVPSEPVMAVVDQELVRRGLDNLIDNAIRYAKRSDGRVVARLEARDERAHIEVEDDGPGVPPEVADRVFEKWAQADGMVSGTRRRLNRGLGLTFVRLMARAHGGEVSFQSPRTGGSIFHLELPQSPPIIPGAG
ncbi:MAG TPA: HAMP domain-containing sensor histidine kinase [Polyangiaceae bacterium LLY-WYZ-14_1]|nr:HAMP domain-containing sensor histidine kinase [Polyangiaceae bacterium LLY-WYZ-14_1]